MSKEIRQMIDRVKNLGKSLNENVDVKYMLYFTSKYGLQTQEFENFLNNNNIVFKKNNDNIFIHDSKTTNYELIVDNKTRKMIFDFIKTNRLGHIEKTGDHLVNIEN